MNKTKDEQEVTQAQQIPPYTSYKTFRNFIDSLRVGIPGRIDRSVMPSMSGAVQSQLVAALRYLGLITESGTPTDKLPVLVNSEGQERQKVLRDILHSAYTFLFKGLEIQRATTRQIEEQFESAGASGETIRKCVAFFFAAAKEADIPLSPHIKPPRAARTGAARRRGLPLAPNSMVGREERSAPAGTAEGHEAVLTWSQLLLSKFPSFDPGWPDEVKAKWFDAFEKLMEKVQKEKQE